MWLTANTKLKLLAKRMSEKMRNLEIRFLLLACLLSFLTGKPTLAVAAGATTELYIVKYAADGTTILEETTVSYQWMEDTLPVYGDGATHYYHQGPVFEGDMWDPSETQNLKDKGALKGTNARDLCELVGGMRSGDEVSFMAVDGWHTEFAYENIYEPQDRQGPIVLAWYNGAEPEYGEKYGIGYPGLEGYHTGMQMVFMAGTSNEAGQYVFGNEDMRLTLPQEEYQHFYQGFPSTNGLSGKWINRLIIYSQEEPPPAGTISQSVSREPLPEVVDTQTELPSSGSGSGGFLTPMLWLALGLGGIGLALISLAFIRLRRKAD
jgi:hypothetical protein